MTLKLGYNVLVNTALKKLGTSSLSEVTVHPELEKKANEFLAALEDVVLVEINFLQNTSKGRDALRYFGVTVAKAQGRDSGAYVPPSVNLLTGSVGSGGSRNNWTTYATEGTVMRFRVPRIIFEKHKNRYEVIESKIVDFETDLKIDDLI